MKTIMKYAIVAIVLVVAVMASFRTENLTEKLRREQMTQHSTAEIVEAMFRDSIATLPDKAVTVRQLLDGIGDDAFVAAHSRVLGIGSPSFYVVKGELEAPTFVDDELRAVIDGVEITIPLRYIFGNTARDASGWFCIDDFRNTPDFNAVSAEMNHYIRTTVTDSASQKFSDVQTLTFVGATSVSDKQLTRLTVIPYILK